MKIDIKHIKIDGNDVYVVSTYTTTGALDGKKLISCPRRSFKEDGYRYLLLFDENCILRRDMFRFLNTADHLGLKPWNTREQYSNALHHLLCFCAIENKQIEHLNNAFYNRFKSFLLGQTIGDSRCPETVGNYLSCCHTFLEAMGYESKCFEHKRPKRNPHKNDAFPTYVSIEQMIDLLEVVKKHNDENAEILLILMFVFGPRIGSLLGATWEDLTEGVSYQTGEPYACLKLRNRKKKKKKWAQNKRKPPVFETEVYDSSDYDDWTYEIRMPYQLSDYIRKKLMARHKRIAKLHPEKYQKCNADIVTPLSDPNRISRNRYLFINEQGTVLSYDSWNRKLKEYFVEARIPLDGKSVSHRIRHGAVKALQRVSNGQVPDSEIAMFLNHAGVQSVDTYKKETLDEIYESLNEYTTKVLQLITSIQL